MDIFHMMFYKQMLKCVSLASEERDVVYCNQNYSTFLSDISEIFELKEDSFNLKGIGNYNFSEKIITDDNFEIERSERSMALERLKGRKFFECINNIIDAEDFLLVYGFVKDEKDRTPLFLSARDGHLDIVESILKKNFDNAHQEDYRGNTPLNWASRNGHLDIVKAILKKNFDNAHQANKTGGTPIHIATYKNNFEIVDILLEKNFDNAHQAVPEGRTPLSRAVREGNLDIVKLLLEKNFNNAHQEDFEGNTPLIWAAKGGHLNIIDLLVVDLKSRISV